MKRSDYYRHMLVGATETSDGLIAHRPSPDGSIPACPVKVYPVRSGEQFPEPVRKQGRLIYALPGGGEFAA